jgi:hypothetical protein
MTNGEGRALVALPSLGYKPGWLFKVGGPGNRFLCIYAETIDSQHQDRNRLTQHMFEIPNEGDFVRWVFDCLLLCELHEAGEFFTVDGVAPFFPNHQDEGSPYELVDRREKL